MPEKTKEPYCLVVEIDKKVIITVQMLQEKAVTEHPDSYGNKEAQNISLKTASPKIQYSIPRTLHMFVHIVLSFIFFNMYFVL